jgi:Na+-transporting NADH:ubiquinone oxidoreductase subunit NqrC
MNAVKELLLLLLIISLLVAGAYFYYTDSQNKMMQLTKEKAELVIINNSYKETLEFINKQNEMNEQRNKELNVKLKQSEEYGDKLISKLRRHNLTALTMQKPVLIENRVNNATKEVFNDLERITSSTD